MCSSDLNSYARVEVRLANGRVLSGELDYTRGSARVPFSDAVMAGKFRSLTEVVLPGTQIDAIMQAVDGLEHLQSMAALVPLLQRPAQ